MPRAIAFYLPQYHPIPENDRWWGKGFTEWTNVAKARPLFPWHYQPHLPSDLGYYDLRVPEVRQLQAELAGEYGIHGFCYYHYWFNGRRLLERPFNEVLTSGEPDFPFCLCWANENWTRVWNGGEDEVLMAQQYCAEDDRRHMRWLCGAFADPRYIRVDGKPLFLVYRVSQLPDPRRTAEIWREEADKAGIGQILLASVASNNLDQRDPRALGFDYGVEFQPNWSQLGSPLPLSLFNRLSRRNGQKQLDRVFDYREMAERMLALPVPEYPRFSCVMPSWDNTARRQGKQRKCIMKDATPDDYQYWLSRVIERDQHRQDVVFINAWNEWAEGNHIEPCQRWGRGYLEATQAALGSTAQAPAGS
jgi:lipopolysaccharide biosynthesis protein